MEACLICSKSFQALPTLRHHLKKIHLFDADKISELVPRKKNFSSFKYVCTECSKCFNVSKNYRYHLRKVHKLYEPESHKKPDHRVKCPLCSNKAHERDMAQHFKTEHDVTLEIDNLEFDNCNTFFQWKKKIERNTNCKFILKRRKLKHSHEYICHRSGEFKPKGKGLRRLKIQGSKKTGTYCPAAIHLKISNEKCYAKFTETHIGHDNKLCHITLTPAEREEIAKKLLNIPKNMVLEEIRESFDGQSSRIHLLTTKDLHNISRDYGTSDEVKNVDVSVSVNILITEMQFQENSPIAYYKPQDCTDTANPFLTSTDFVLIIMNDAQKKMLSTYGKNFVCFDGTHDMGYDFNLYTILVLDSVYQGFPCCFLLTNRTDEAIFTFLFTKIKNTIPKLNENDAEINTFMSDMEEAFINAWVNVMGMPKQQQLFCTWHVNRIWKQDLAKMVNGRQKQNQVYSLLRILMEEVDEYKFEMMLLDTVAKLKTDPCTNDFASYFEENYFCNADAWAYCHRRINLLNSNTNLESMHRALKYAYLEGKKVKRLDKTICLLMKLIKDELFEQMMVTHKVKITKKMVTIRRRHQIAINETNLITYDNSSCKWKVSSKKLYYIERSQFDCRCDLSCILCQSCIHNYSCTCVDYVIRGNMCKHIHQVCMMIKAKQNGDLGNHSSPECEDLIQEDEELSNHSSPECENLKQEDEDLGDHSAECEKLIQEDEDLGDHSPECENLILLPQVKETLPNSQNKGVFEVLGNHPSEYINLIPLLEVKETVSNSQHGRKIELAIKQEMKEGNTEDTPVENLQNVFDEVLDSAKTSEDRKLVLSYLNKVKLCFQSRNGSK